MGKIIAIIIIIIVIFGGFYLWQTNSQKNAPRSGNQAIDRVIPGQDTEISYTDTGFSPKEVNIKVGDTVTWTNGSTKQMWVASAPHPVHTDYPEFDAKQASSQGGTYSFTFQKPGDWKYHNHMNPTDFGIVHVTQ